MGDPRAERSRPTASPTLAVLNGSEAVTSSERILVGDALTRDPAVAEGLALAGVRAASVSADAGSPSTGNVALAAVSCVHHVTAAPGAVAGGAFELAATSAQEAADDCLAAHLLSRRLGRPGLCSLTPKLAGDLASVELPDAAEAAERLAGDALAQEPSASPERITELAREALAEAGLRSGRPSAPVVIDGDADADLVLVAAGGAAAASRTAVQTLVAAGVPARDVIVRLLRPFPTALVRKALLGARQVIIVGAEEQGFAAAVRSAAGAETELREVAVAESDELLETLRALLPVSDIDLTRAAAPEKQPLAHRLVVAPDSPWGESTARQALALLAAGGALRIGRRTRHHRGTAVLAFGGGAVADAARDVLIASHPAAVEPEGLAQLRPRSTVVVLSDAPSSAALVRGFSDRARAVLREHAHRIVQVLTSDRDAPLEQDSADRAETRGVAAAVFAAVAHAEASGEVTAQPGDAVIRAVDPADLAADANPQETDFRATPQLPRMPEAHDDAEARAAWARWLRRFHLSGAATGEHAPPRPMRPAAFGPLEEELRRESPHPFVLLLDASATPPVAASGLHDLVAGALAEGHHHARSLAEAVERALVRNAAGSPLGALLVEAGDELSIEPTLSDEAAAGLREDLTALRAALPEEAGVFDLRPDTPIRVYLEVLAAMRSPLEQRYAEELAELREVLLDRLQLDRMRSDEGHSAEALASELGGGANRLLDPDALATTLPGDPGWSALGELHRRRLTEALDLIEQYLGRAEPLPLAVFLRPPDVELRVPGAPPIEHPDPLAAAVGTFDGIASSMAPLFRAVRLARLEVAQRYRPELHDEPLAGLDWEAFDIDELSLMPAVTVVTTGRRIRRRGQDSLSELLRSSRPVRVIVRDDVAAADEAEEISRHHLELGQLVMAHREAFALSSTLARPQLLVEGLARMLREPRPGVVLVSLPAGVFGAHRGLLAEAARWGRACPDFLYDPDAGPGWSDRFDVTNNPQPGRAWPLLQLAYLEDGVAKTLETAFTFADAMALEPAYLRHLRVIPRVAWNDDAQLPLSEFIMELDPERGVRGIPFLWVVDEADRLQRAVVSRELTLACRDRLRGWRVLQELGGFENADDEGPTSTAHETAQIEDASERAELDRTQASTLAEARAEGAREAIARLAIALVYPDGHAATAPLPEVAAPLAGAAVAPAATTPAGSDVAPPEAPAESVSAAPAVIRDPYIDTFLCTSCKECTDINSRMFKYDDNKQAFIADAGAGSFAELVKAATLCPAKCIHPGQPRSGDATATPKLIARAAEFN